jgi:hypothetical protein
VGGPYPSPIGLTDADLFAGGEVSRADSRVRQPALSPVLVALRPDRPLMPYRRRITIRRQSGGGPLLLPRSSGTRWSSPNRSLVTSVHQRPWQLRTSAPCGSGPPSRVAKLAGMRRILLGGVAGVLLLAVGTRAADALGIGGPRLRCGCTETCWCKRPGLTVFRWVTPGRWHHIGLTAEEKRSRHSQAWSAAGKALADAPGAP